MGRPQAEFQTELRRLNENHLESRYCRLWQVVIQYRKHMMTISFKLPEALLREVEHEAASRGVPKSAVIRDSLEQTLRKRRKAKRRPNCLELMGDAVGHFAGPPDLSTNKKYLIEAVLADANRSRKNPR